MAAFRWAQNIGLPGFGMDDLSNYSSKGYSDSDIKSFLEGNRQYFGYGKMGVGDDVRQRLGLDEGFINHRTSDTPEQRYEKARTSYSNYLLSNTPKPIELPNNSITSPTDTDFNASYYLQKNPDVRDAISRMRQSGQQSTGEYDWVGRYNGLLGDKGGTEDSTLKFLQEPFGKWVPKTRQISDLSELTDAEAAKLHFDHWGSKEGRKYKSDSPESTTPESVTVKSVGPPVQDFRLDEQAKQQKEYLDSRLAQRTETFQQLLNKMLT